jgi:hypothetical protein
VKYNLNNRFILSSDSHNWILTDRNRGANNQNKYFPNLKQLSSFLTDIKAKECLAKCGISLCDKPSAPPSYHSVINTIVKDLECYFKEITNNEKN